MGKSIDRRKFRGICLQKLDNQLTKQFGLRNVRISRAIENNGGEDVPKRYCYNTACGWAVYERDLRSIEYYMKNT